MRQSENWLMGPPEEEVLGEEEQSKLASHSREQN